MGGEAKAEGTDTVVPGTFGFKYYEGGRVHPGENRMVILFTPQRYGGIHHGGMYPYRGWGQSARSQESRTT